MTPHERRQRDILAEIRNITQVLVLKIEYHHRVHTCGDCRDPFLANLQKDIDYLIELTRERRNRPLDSFEPKNS